MDCIQLDLQPVPVQITTIGARRPFFYFPPKPRRYTVGSVSFDRTFNRPINSPRPHSGPRLFGRRSVLSALKQNKASDPSTSVQARQGDTSTDRDLEEAGEHGENPTKKKIFIRRLGTREFHAFRKVESAQGRVGPVTTRPWSKMAIVRVNRRTLQNRCVASRAEGHSHMNARI